jgi:hypothetical protein
MKRLICVVWVALLAGCASVVMVQGDQTVNNRMTVTVTEAWNKVPNVGNNQPFDVWTQEGLSLDHLRLWAAIKTGQSLMTLPSSSMSSAQKAPRAPTYKAGMPPDELVGLFEIMYAADGSIVNLTKVEPTSFAGESGVRFEFSVVRKSDDVQLRGVGWVAVRNNELFGATFVAPRLSFFPRLLPKAESVVGSARIK